MARLHFSPREVDEMFVWEVGAILTPFEDEAPTDKKQAGQPRNFQQTAKQKNQARFNAAKEAGAAIPQVKPVMGQTGPDLTNSAGVF